MATRRPSNPKDASDDVVRSAVASASSAKDVFDALSRQKESDLYLLLARRVTETAEGSLDTANFAAPFSIDDIKRGNSIKELGQRIFLRWSRAMHDFLCSKSKDDVALRDRLMKAIITKDGGLVALTSATLVACFGLSPAVAAIIAALLLKIVFEPAGDEICAFWGEQLRKVTSQEGRA